VQPRVASSQRGKNFRRWLVSPLHGYPNNLGIAVESKSLLRENSSCSCPMYRLEAFEGEPLFISTGIVKKTGLVSEMTRGKQARWSEQLWIECETWLRMRICVTGKRYHIFTQLECGDTLERSCLRWRRILVICTRRMVSQQFRSAWRASQSNMLNTRKSQEVYTRRGFFTQSRCFFSCQRFTLLYFLRDTNGSRYSGAI